MTDELSRDYSVFYYPKRLIEEKLCHLFSVIESNKGDKAVEDALQEEISQYRKAISLLTPVPITKGKCQKCVYLFELFENTQKTNRDYWLITELFVILHGGDVCNG